MPQLSCFVMVTASLLSLILLAEGTVYVKVYWTKAGNINCMSVNRTSDNAVECCTVYTRHHCVSTNTTNWKISNAKNIKCKHLNKIHKNEKLLSLVMKDNNLKVGPSFV